MNALLLILVASASALRPAQQPNLHRRAAPVRRMVAANRGGVGSEFGQVFYMGAEYEYPNGPLEPLAEGVFEVALKKPCGIVFEERATANTGVEVVDLVDGGNAAASEKIAAGDVLVGVTGVICKGAKYQREMCDATAMDFDTVIGAIGSNEAKWQCKDVILQFARPAP